MTVPARLRQEAFSLPLGERGFSQLGRRNLWMRDSDEIGHAVSLEHSHGSWKVRWDVVEPAVGGILHGKVVARSDVAYSGIVTGTAQPSMRPGVIAAFTTEDAESGKVLSGVKLAVLQVAEWLDEFPDVPTVLEYLTRDSEKPDPRISFPAHKPLRLLTAAALAAVFRRPEAAELAALAREAIGQRRDPIAQKRLARLATALS